MAPGRAQKLGYDRATNLPGTNSHAAPPHIGQRTGAIFTTTP
jgi:hypothetical protein